MMKSKEQCLESFESAFTLYAKYLELWCNFDMEPDYQKDWSKEFIAYMLLSAKGDLDRYENALKKYKGDNAESLFNSKRELDKLFEEEVVRVNGEELRETLSKALDCRALIPTLNEYLGLYDYYSNESSSESDIDFDLVEVGCDLLIDRDELQLVMNQLDTAWDTPTGMSKSCREALEIRTRELKAIDYTIFEHRLAFKPLKSFIRNFRRQFSKEALDPQKYSIWYLDEFITPEKIPNLGKIAIRIREKTLNVLRSFGEIFRQYELLPVPVLLRDGRAVTTREPEQKLEFTIMRKYIGHGITIEIKVAHNERGYVVLLLVAYRSTLEEDEVGISGLGVNLKSYSGESVLSGKTSDDGTMYLGEWSGEGDMTIEISDDSGKIGDLHLKIER